MFCKHCGERIDDDSLFCPKCGKKQNMGSSPLEQTEPLTTNPLPNAISKDKITPRSCPKCGATEHRVTKNNSDSGNIKQVRICVNCGNNYRTVKDVQEDIDTCKGKIIGLSVCAVISTLVLTILFAALKVGDTLEYWDWVDNNRKMTVYYFLFMVIVCATAIIPGFTKRAKEMDNLAIEKEQIQAEYSALCAKYEIPDMSGTLTDDIDYSDVCTGEVDCLICAECEELNPVTATTCLNCGCELYNPYNN